MRIINFFKYLNKTGLKRNKQFLLYNYYDNEFDGTVDEIEYDVLKNLSIEANKINKMFMVEIGALFGLSTQAILEGISSKTKVISIDNFMWNPIGLTPKRHEKLLNLNMQYFLNKKMLEIHNGDSSSENLVKRLNNNVSLVYIDGDHSYEGVKKDINFAKKINANIICGDDFHFSGVKKAVEENFKNSFEIINSTFWIYRKS